jgi:RecJ-like exonuclease
MTALNEKDKLKQRRQFDFIRRQGNYRVCNVKTEISGKGIIIPCKRTDTYISPNQIMNCSRCYKTMKRDSIRRHQKTCPRRGKSAALTLEEEKLNQVSM